MNKRIILFALVAALFVSCTTAKTYGASEVSIIYTNDVHTYINNMVKVDGNYVSGLRFSKIAGLVKDMKNEGKEVILVDAGDAIQGTSYGSFDGGFSVIDLMNATGYKLAAIGNHEFDYGADHFYDISKRAKFDYVSCNLHYIGKDGKHRDFAPYKIIKAGGRKIAFIGICTPETLTSSSPTNFQNENGEFIYSVDGCASEKDLYASVQNSIDAVKSKVDFCIALGHLGVSMGEIKGHISSADVIENTKGLDAFIGGHSHTIILGEKVKDLEGKEVLSTQTGSYLSAVGIMTLGTDGKIKTKFLKDYGTCDAKVAKLEDKLVDSINQVYGNQIAVLETKLDVNSPEIENQRLIRAQEMNIGDFVADSVYWFFNVAQGLDCDVAIINGGGIRTFIKDGPVTVNDMKNVQPFGNMVCLIKATGQQILDALEMGTTVTGEWDYEWNSPAENGGFLQVAGIKYEIDPSYKSSVKKDEKGMFVSVEGKYRVKNVCVFNKKKGAYEPLDMKKTYSLAGINYLLRNSGNGLSMFRNCDAIVDYAGQDYEILAEYCRSFIKDGTYARIKTEGSRLKEYKGYLIDYENPFGAGRIQILKK